MKYNNIPDWAVRTKADKLCLEKGYYWDQAKADHVIAFTNKFCRSQFIEEDTWTLAQFQVETLQNLHAWKRPDATSRWHTACLHWARGNGKNYMGAVCIAYELFFSNYKVPIINSASVDQRGATQIWKDVVAFIQQSPEMRKHKPEIIKSKGSQSIHIPTKNSTYQSVSSEGKGSLGHNLNYCLLDEAAWIDDPLIWAALTTGQIKRKKGVMKLSISTASFNNSSWYYNDLYLKAKNILDGADLDYGFYADVQECPMGEEHTQEGWKKANPGWGVCFDSEKFKTDTYDAMKSSPGQFVMFRVLHCNQFLSNKSGDWFNVANYDAGKRDTFTTEFLQKYPAVVSIDGSEADCPSSITIGFALGDDEFYLESYGYACSGAMKKREHTHLPKFESFEQAGCFKIQPTPTIELKELKDKIISLCTEYDVREIVFDSHNLRHIAEELTDNGYECTKFAQTPSEYATPVKEWIRSCERGKIRHNGNLWQRYCLTNSVLKTDSNGNSKLDRESSSDFIDGAISAVMCFGALLKYDSQIIERETGYDQNIYFW